MFLCVKWWAFADVGCFGFAQIRQRARQTANEAEMEMFRPIPRMWMRNLPALRQIKMLDRTEVWSRLSSAESTPVTSKNERMPARHAHGTTGRLSGSEFSQTRTDYQATGKRSVPGYDDRDRQASESGRWEHSA